MMLVTDTNSRSALSLRAPTREDGAGMWRLVKDSGSLDLNSAYCYIMLGESFSETCVVAESEGVLAGFVTAFRKPAATDTLFVWQIAVDRAHRGQGVGLSLLTTLLCREACRGVSVVETTITPSNRPSKALFSALARALGTTYTEHDGFPAHAFPDQRHEREDLVRIGPFDPNITRSTKERSWR